MLMKSHPLIKKVRWLKHKKQRLPLKNYFTRMVVVVMIIWHLKKRMTRLNKVNQNTLILLIHLLRLLMKLIKSRLISIEILWIQSNLIIKATESSDLLNVVHKKEMKRKMMKAQTHQSQNLIGHRMTSSKEECLRLEEPRWQLELFLNHNQVIEGLSHHQVSIARHQLKVEIESLIIMLIRKRVPANLIEAQCYLK